MGLECRHEWPIKFQLLPTPQLFKHPFHKGDDFFPVLTDAAGQSLRGASGADQCPFPSSRVGAEIASQDATEIAPVRIGNEVSGARLSADDRSFPFQLHHLSGSP